MKNLEEYDKYIPLERGGSSNFKYIEFIRSQTAFRKNIDNIPSSGSIKNMEKLVNYGMQPVRDMYGPIIITSGYRSPELCKELGGSIYSNHTNGSTADFKPLYSQIKLITILNYIHNNLDYRELIAEFFPTGWIHYSYLEGGNKRDLKLKDANHNYERVSIDYINSLYSIG